MQPVTEDKLRKLISEAEAEGKDTSELRKMLGQESSPVMGEVRQKDGKAIVSTGPAREKDFET